MIKVGKSASRCIRSGLYDNDGAQQLGAALPGRQQAGDDYVDDEQLRAGIGSA